MSKKATQRLSALASGWRKIEVESKFKPTQHSINLLRDNLGSPAFRSLHFSGSTSFRDEYYDYKRILEQRNIWVRKRDDKWEAKCRKAGDFVDSTFEEIEGEEGVMKVVCEACRASSVSEALQLDQLQRTAMFSTTRLEWLANERFSIAIDSTDFGHRVGEVELIDRIPPEEDGPNVGDELTSVLRADLKRFMSNHSWAFPCDGHKPIGKLSAYFARFPLPC